MVELLKFAETEKFPFLFSFAAKRLFPPQYIGVWEKEYPEISSTLNTFRAISKAKLIEAGLTNKSNAFFTHQTLKNVDRTWRDRQDIAVKHTGLNLKELVEDANSRTKESSDPEMEE